MFTASDSHYDLPLYPRMGRASRHDAVSLIVSIKEFERYNPDWRWKQVLLDAAHDALPIYRYFESKGTLPFIDLNQRKTVNKKYKDDITVSPEESLFAKKGWR